VTIDQFAGRWLSAASQPCCYAPFWMFSVAH
jgi:hypothetical protein